MVVKKAVIPCGGFGSRFLPITKIIPKEILPIVDTPSLEYQIQEVVNSGIEEVLIILSPTKGLIKQYFEPNVRLEEFLLKWDKFEEYNLIAKKAGVKISFVIQHEMNGNGNAILLAKEFCNGEPVAVLFGDDVMYTGDNTPVTKQLIDCYQQTGKLVVGVQNTTEDIARKCGVMILGENFGKTWTIKGVLEKPTCELPSSLVSLGRFILTPDIFDELESFKELRNDELYLTDVINKMAKEDRVVCYDFDGKRYDLGSKQGYLEATIEFALRNNELAPNFKKYLKTLVID